MRQLFLLAAVICFGVAILKFYSARMGTGAPAPQGHIDGAVCFPNEDILPELPLPFEKDTELLLYCRSGRRSAEAAEKLAGMGYTNVADFGGMQEWPAAE